MGRSSLIIFACVVIMTLGQVLFKKVAINYNKHGDLLDPGVLGLLMVACSMYVISTGLWVWALRFVDISKAYPYFAFGFVLVPFFGVWLYGEVVGFKYLIGVLLIIIGVILTSSSQ